MTTKRTKAKYYLKQVQKHCTFETSKAILGMCLQSQTKVLTPEVAQVLSSVEELSCRIKENSRKTIISKQKNEKTERLNAYYQNKLSVLSTRLSLCLVQEQSDGGVAAADNLFNITTFNVSGTNFDITVETIAKEPNSLLYAMATGKVDCLKDSNGRLFIDRNARCFAAIINYLRSDLYDKEAGPVFLRLLYTEAKYFGISSLTRNLCGIEIESIFDLQPEETKALTDWCEAEIITLLYRASIDGFESVKFHEKCDNVSGTLTIIKTVGGCIFGGYSGARWVSEEDPTLAPGTGHEFLFTLRNPQNTGPIQFPVRYDTKYCSILNCKKYGPSFGANARGHCEIHVAEKPNDNINSHVLGFPAMYDGKGHTNKIFCGSDRFQVEDIEVFLVTNKWSKGYARS